MPTLGGIAVFAQETEHKGAVTLSSSLFKR